MQKLEGTGFSRTPRIGSNSGIRVSLVPIEEFPGFEDLLTNRTVTLPRIIKVEEGFKQEKSLVEVVDIKKELLIDYNYECDVCMFSTYSKQLLIQHKQQHQNEENQDDPDPVNTHLTEEEPPEYANDPKRCVCPFCGVSSNTIREHMDHMATHQEPADFMCEWCPFSTSQKAIFTAHTNLHTGKKRQVCKTCGQTFTHLTHLLRHQKYHTNMDKKYRCNYCTFSTDNHNVVYTNHLRHHMKIPPLQCPYCKYSSMHLPAMRFHIRHHMYNNILS